MNVKMKYFVHFKILTKMILKAKTFKDKKMTT